MVNPVDKAGEHEEKELIATAHMKTIYCSPHKIFPYALYLSGFHGNDPRQLPKKEIQKPVTAIMKNIYEYIIYLREQKIVFIIFSTMYHCMPNMHWFGHKLTKKIIWKEFFF